MRIGLVVNSCRSKSPRREKSSGVCTNTHEDVNASSKSSIPREKLIYTLTDGRVPLGSSSFPSLLAPRAGRVPGFLSADPVFMSRQLSVWAGDGLHCQSFCLHSLLLNLNGNSMDNQGLNPAKC